MRSQNKDKRRLGYVVVTFRALFVVLVCRLRTISLTKSNCRRGAGPTNIVFLPDSEKAPIAQLLRYWQVTS